jgi:hypothetical protein
LLVKDYYGKEDQMLLINNEPNKILICGSPTSTEALGHNKEIEARPKGIAQEEEV